MVIVTSPCLLFLVDVIVLFFLERRKRQFISTCAFYIYFLKFQEFAWNYFRRNDSKNLFCFVQNSQTIDTIFHVLLNRSFREEWFNLYTFVSFFLRRFNFCIRMGSRMEQYIFRAGALCIETGGRKHTEIQSEIRSKYIISEVRGKHVTSETSYYLV